MFKNYLKIAYRNLLRHKAYSFINIAGLGVGIACCMLLCLYVQDELSFETSHPKAKNIYRVTAEITQQGEVNRIAQTPPPLAAAMVQDFPEVVRAVRFNQSGQRNLFTYGEKRLYETGGYYTDPNVFDVFNYPLVSGDPKTALKDPLSIVISQEIAQRYFGNGDALNKVIRVELDSTHEFRVSGVLADLPYNMQIRPSFMVSFELFRNNQDNWWAFGYNTFVETKPGVSQTALEKKMRGLFKRHVSAENLGPGVPPEAKLQPLLAIHLDGSYGRESGSINDMAYIYLFCILALFIIGIACINFMNLATARSQERAREVGVRKVVGAVRPQLIRQFLSESLALSLLALILSIILVELSLPAFNQLSGKHLSLQYVDNWLIPVGFLSLSLLVGLAAGIYPAFFLSSFKPVEVLKGKLTGGNRGVNLRRSLVILQFSISIGLIVGTGIVYSQMTYVRNKQLGFNKEQIVVLPLQGAGANRQYQALKTEFLRNPGITHVSIASSLPGSRGWWYTGLQLDGNEGQEDRAAVTFQVDYDFMRTLGVEIVAGRDFSTRFATDSSEAFIVNEAAVKDYGWGTPEKALGRKVSWNGNSKQGRIIGVVKDFHYQSLHQGIGPAIFHVMPNRASLMTVRLQAGQIKPTLAYMQQKWAAVDGEHPFEFTFLDESLNSQYQTVETLGKIFSTFSLLAVFIACLGLYGLAAFTTTQRTKEIGIRKVLGASASNILVLLSREFVVLVLVSLLVASPIAWYGMSRWLENFAYQTPIHWWLFGLAGTIALTIALCTISFQALKAAVANPVKSLRTE
jgi:putative ABC transport system permease protein